MSQSLPANYTQLKIEVDVLNRNDDKRRFECSCYTPGLNSDQEPEYLVRYVTYDEFEKHLCDTPGTIHVTSPGVEDAYPVPFWQWVEQTSDLDMMEYLTIYLNRKEQRTVNYALACSDDPFDLFAAFGKILFPNAKTAA